MQKPKVNKEPRLSLNTLVGVCAIVTSICAIIITLYQTRLQKVQQYASVKPLLMNYSKSFSGGDSKTGKSYHYEFIIVNQGLGPAIVSNYAYSYKSKRFENIAEIIQQIKKENRLDSTKSVALANIWKSEILPVGEKLSLINIDDERLGPLVEKADIKIMVQYKSLYGQEWRFMSNDKSEPQEID
ncbi:hypothetical protein [Pedobacter soli]|uniref:Uncharacterized protein n=1 Tax=Pedobacter soli TaxID=390242 RepID=A0A1G6IM70_9SPHI|nr:hypothetical protein [Pedobacter soli]SDC06846.1 hypothetical protein SAMN04488024_101179 [Pedobacter soli]